MGEYTDGNFLESEEWMDPEAFERIDALVEKYKDEKERRQSAGVSREHSQVQPIAV